MCVCVCQLNCECGGAVKVDTDMDVDQRMARELLDLQSLVELLRAAFACLGLEHDGEHRAVDALTLTCKKRG